VPPLGDALALLASELLEGPAGECYVLNVGDQGLVRSLDRLSAASASAIPPTGGASIAAHVDHVLYGVRLMNRWVGGESNPWAEADWTLSWKRTTVTDEEWRRLREQLRDETRRWRDALSRAGTDLPRQALTGAIAILAHLAYHLGAIRQIDRSIGGPSADQAAS
jgi:hypothetical protein